MRCCTLLPLGADGRVGTLAAAGMNRFGFAGGRVSLSDWYRGNPDVENVPYDHDGIVIGNPAKFTAYDELSRQNPDLGGV
jgi:hypothetical protein